MELFTTVPIFRWDERGREIEHEVIVTGNVGWDYEQDTYAISRLKTVPALELSRGEEFVCRDSLMAEADKIGLPEAFRRNRWRYELKKRRQEYQG